MVRMRIDIEISEVQLRKIGAYHYRSGSVRDKVRSFVEEKLAYAYEGSADPLDLERDHREGKHVNLGIGEGAAYDCPLCPKE